MASDQIKNSQTIVCPVCAGSGKNKYGFSCLNCLGMGLGSFFQGRFFYWGLRMGRAVIELNHIRKKVHFLTNLAAFGMGLAGLMGLAFWIYISSAHSAELGAFDFWRERHTLILFFWCSLLADMFVIYRLSEEERQKHKIKSYRYEEMQKRMGLPNNWEELKKYKSKYRLNVLKGYEERTLEVIEHTFLLALKLNHKKVTPIHLFFSCMADTQVAAILTRLNIDVRKLSEKIKEQIARIDRDEMANQEPDRKIDKVLGWT